MKQQHHPWDKKNFRGGANTDAKRELVARSDGTYIDADNMRIADQRGGNGALTKLRGETLAFGPDSPGADTYECIGSTSVKGNMVSIWASHTPISFPPIIQINGVTMVRNEQIPYVWDKQLQLHSSQDCEGGIVFDARSGAVPIHWPIGHIMAAFAANEQTYFTGFDITSVQVNATRPLNRPRFRGFVNVGLGGGLVAGQVWYFTRYVNDTGDRSTDGPEVGPVMVPFISETGGLARTPAFPQAGISGPTPDQIGIRTKFGAQLRIRINNQADFQSMEIVRVQYTLNGGPDAEPEVVIAHRRAVAPGERGWFDFVDTGLVVEAIPTDESNLQQYYIKEANSVRYLNYRVVYGGVLIGKRDIRGTYVGDVGDQLVPFTAQLGPKGHSDPINHCYKRRFQSGERHSIGVVYYDEGGGVSYVDRVQDNFQMPNRRDEKSADSLAISDKPCYAANVDGEVTPTYEVFDLDTAEGRSQTGQVVNIMVNGARKIDTQNFVGQAYTSNADPAENFIPYGQNNDGVYVSADVGGLHLKTAYTKPLRPVDPADYKFGLDYRANKAVQREGQPVGGTPLDYNPEVFDVNHHTMGIALRGVAAQPPGTQGFSIVASKPAGRVLGQVLCKWRIRSGPQLASAFDGVNAANQATKDVFQLHVCFPDFNAGSVNQEIWERLIAADGTIGLQLVSALGFATEMFGSVNMMMGDNAVFGSVTCLADVMSYVRVLWDNGQINPGNNSGGISPADPLPLGQDHFTAFGSWRNNLPASMPWGGPADAIIPIAGGQEVVHDSGVRSLILTMGAAIYNTSSAGGNLDFDDGGVKGFQEPWYVANIVQEGVQANDRDGYIPLNHYQAFRSVIGVTDGSSNQRFTVVDENPDDFLSTVTGDERFIYVKTPQGVRPYLYIIPFIADNATIVAAIAADGFWTTPGGVNVYGRYIVDQGPLPEDNEIKLLNSATPAGCEVEVRYRGSYAKAFGDMITSPAITTVCDAAATANPAAGNFESPVYTDSGVSVPVYLPTWFTGAGNGTQVLQTNGLPIPFAHYKYNDRYMVPFGLGHGSITGANAGFSVNQLPGGTLLSVRQWKAMFDCEVRSPLYLCQYAADGPNSYPQRHYVQRPYNFISTGNTLVDNGVHTNYQDVTNYPSVGVNQWPFGGFHFARQEVLSDYAIPRLPAFFRKAEFGFEEQERQCSLLVYSEKDAPLIQDSPGLKTFPVSNAEFIDNVKGGIQRLYTSDSGNLFVVTEGAVFEVLIEKSTAYSADGTEFSMFAQDKFIGQVVLRTKETGMPKDTWRTAAEGAPTVGAVRQESLFWYDGTSAYALKGSTVVDIGIHRFREALRQAYDTSLNTKVFGAFDKEKDELFMDLGNRVLMRGENWMGGCDYRFDSMLYHDNKLYGFRKLSTFLLDSGDTMNGEPVRGTVTVSSSPFPGERMEWVRVKVNSVRKPSRIEFFDETGTLVCWMDEATFGPLYIKRETDWEHYVPRKNEAVDAKKSRLQGRVASYKIIFAEAGDDEVVQSEVQVKPLK